MTTKEDKLESGSPNWRGKSVPAGRVETDEADPSSKSFGDSSYEVRPVLEGSTDPESRLAASIETSLILAVQNVLALSGMAFSPAAVRDLSGLNS